mgnify:CR=1 FL=1
MPGDKYGDLAAIALAAPGYDAERQALPGTPQSMLNHMRESAAMAGSGNNARKRFRYPITGRALRTKRSRAHYNATDAAA